MNQCVIDNNIPCNPNFWGISPDSTPGTAVWRPGKPQGIRRCCHAESEWAR